MKRLTPVVTLVVLLAGLAYGLGVFDSDETRIRSLFVDAADSFNDTNLSGCLEGFAEDYRDETEKTVDRARLTLGLRSAFLRMVDPKTKAFLLRLRMPDEAMSVDIGDPADTATADTATAVFTLYVERRREEGWQPEWQVRVTAKLKKVDGKWRIHRSSHETMGGARPR